MKKLILSLIGLVLVFGLATMAKAATTSVVSDTNVDVIGVYNKYSDSFVDLSSSPNKAVIAAEPTTYPTIYSVGALGSVWDNGTGLYFQNTNPGASWIWDTTHAEDASSSPGTLADPDASSNGRVVVFQKTFDIPGIPQDSTLDIAADNGWEAMINGTYLAQSVTTHGTSWYTTDLHEADLNSTGWQTVGHITIPAAMLHPGSNTVTVYAGNEYYDPVNPNFEYNNSPSPAYVANPYRQQNPGAVIFKLDAQYIPVTPLTVSKTADASYTRTWDWTIDKNVNPTTLTLATGEQSNANYTVGVNATSTDSAWAVNGNITINNPNAVAANITNITDTLGTVTCPGDFSDLAGTLAAGATLECTYSGILQSGTNTTNTVNVTTSGDIPGGNGSADVVFSQTPTSEIDECVNVSDSLQGSLGQVCANGTLPHTYSYQRTVGPYTNSGTYYVDNTATAITTDTVTSHSDSARITVNVPSPGCTLTQGYWKTHSNHGPAKYDDAWALITPGGADKLFFSSGQSYYKVLWTAPSGGNAYYQLAHQYIAAKLNTLNGASAPSNVSSALTSAAGLFGTYTPSQIGSLKGNDTLRKTFLSLAETLGNYNEGLIGPGHCNE